MRDPLGNRSAGVVFLCYHSIADRGEPFLALPPETFERQLALLRRLGFRSGTLADLDLLAEGGRPSGRTAFLTFDDGFKDTYQVALPLMREYGFRPLVFVLPRHLDTGAPLDWPEVAATALAEPELMRSITWEDVGAMREEGAEFGSHTLTHPHLPELDDATLETELGQSKALVEERLGRCDAIAYPFGDWDPRVAAAARRAGYRFAFSLPHGPQAEVDALCIPRINVDSRDRGSRFLAKLTPPARRLLLSSAGDRVRDVVIRLR